MRYRPEYSTQAQRDQSLYLQCPPEPVNAALFYPKCPEMPYYELEPVLFCMCLYGESREEPAEGIAAVAQVILNRWLRLESQFGFTVRDVILKRTKDGGYQFNCMYSKDSNYPAILKPEWVGWLKCFKSGMDFYFHPRPLTADSAFFYINNKIQLPAFFRKLRQVNSIGNHDFYSDL